MRKIGIFITMALILGLSSILFIEDTVIVKASQSGTTLVDLTTHHDGSITFEDHSSNHDEFDPFYFGGAGYTYKDTLAGKISVILLRNGGMTDYWADASTVLYTKSGNPYSSGSGHRDYEAGSSSPYGIEYVVSGKLFYTFHHSVTNLQTNYYGTVFDNIWSYWTIIAEK